MSEAGKEGMAKMLICANAKRDLATNVLQTHNLESVPAEFKVVCFVFVFLFCFFVNENTKQEVYC